MQLNYNSEPWRSQQAQSAEKRSAKGGENLVNRARGGRRVCLAAPPAAIQRGERLAHRLRNTPRSALPNVGIFNRLAPDLLAAMFDTVEVDRVAPPRCYRLHTTELALTVLLNGETWRWCTLLGCAEGGSLLSLWSWRFDVPLELAAFDIEWALGPLPGSDAEAA